MKEKKKTKQKMKTFVIKMAPEMNRLKKWMIVAKEKKLFLRNKTEDHKSRAK